MSGSSARTERTGPIDRGHGRVEDRDEARDVAFDDFLVDHVGLVDAGLGSGVGRVLDLHRQRGPRVAGATRVGQAGERRDRRGDGGRRGRRGRRGVLRRRRLRVATPARGREQRERRDDGRRRDGPGSELHYISCNRLMRSSRGGWVSKRLLNFEPGLLLIGLERLLDPHLRGGLGGVVHDGVVVAQLLQRGDQPRWVPRELHAARVGEVLAVAAHRHLHEVAGERRQHEHRQRRDRDHRAERAGVAVVVAPAAHAAPEREAQPDVGDQRDGADGGDRDGGDEDVVVLHVRELVRDHALELHPVHDLEQPGRDRERGVLRVAPGGERVRRGIVDDVELGLREARGDAEALDEVVVAAVLGLVGRLGPAGGDGDLVGVEVGAPRERHGDDERDDDADPAATEEQHDRGRRQHDDRRRSRAASGTSGACCAAICSFTGFDLSANRAPSPSLLASAEPEAPKSES